MRDLIEALRSSGGKQFIGEVGNFLYAVKIPGFDPSDLQRNMSGAVALNAALKAWRESGGIKEEWISTKPRKGQKPGPELRKWVKAVAPSEFYARWDLSVDDDTRKISFKATDYSGNVRATYEGAVLGTHIVSNERLMSDVWANATYADVWDGEKVLSVRMGDGEFGHEGTVTVDATPEVLEAVAARRAVEAEKARVRAVAMAEAEKARRAKEAKEVARAFVFGIRKGVRVKTTARRGRGAPALGTEGVVFWTGESTMGTARVGFKTDAGETVWTTANNCQAVTVYDWDTEPAEGWEAIAKALKEVLKAAEPKTYAVGTKVQLVDGYVGVVFWAKGVRCGAKVNPRDRNAEPRWFNADEVAATV